MANPIVIGSPGDATKHGSSKGTNAEGPSYPKKPHVMMNGVLSKSDQQDQDLTRKAGGQTDNYRHYAYIHAGPNGGKYRIPSLGVELRIPPGALAGEKRLTVSIPMTDNFPWNCKTLSPHVRIEPNLEYMKPIQILVDHSMMQYSGKTEETQPPILLYRHHGAGPWQFIQTQNITDGNVKKICKDIDLQMCTDEKSGLVHPAYVEINMKSNCDICLVEYRNDLGVMERVRRVGLEVYAHVIEPDAVELRVYMIHGIMARRTDVKRLEQEYQQSNFISAGLMHVNPHHDAVVKLKLTQQPQARIVQRDVMVQALKPEWEQNPYLPPIERFHLTTTDGRLDVTIEASHGLVEMMEHPSSNLDISAESVHNLPWE